MGVKAEGMLRVCQGESSILPHPLDSHFQFSIKTLLSEVLKKQWVAPTGSVKTNVSHSVFRTMGCIKVAKTRLIEI